MNGIEYERVRTEERLREFRECVETAYLGGSVDPAAWAAALAERLPTDDFTVALDRGAAVGAFWSFAQTMTAIGGAVVPTRAISSVAVLPTHRRRGILTTMMRRCLGDAREDGYAAAALGAAEYGIYGRYGFGPAMHRLNYRIRVNREALPPVPDGDYRMVDGPTYLAASTAVHAQVSIAGKVSRPPRRGERYSGLAFDDPAKYRRVVLYRAGDPVGIVLFHADEAWVGGVADARLTVVELLAARPADERALWAFVMNVDWVTTVLALRPADDLVVAVPPNPRYAEVVGRIDDPWLRPLDVPALFTARSYASPGRVVLEVHDGAWPGGAGPAHGRFAIESAGGAGECRAVADVPDLRLDVTSLAALWTADTTSTWLRDAGLATELTPGAAGRLDGMLAASRRAWMVDAF